MCGLVCRLHCGPPCAATVLGVGAGRPALPTGASLGSLLPACPCRRYRRHLTADAGRGGPVGSRGEGGGRRLLGHAPRLGWVGWVGRKGSGEGTPGAGTLRRWLLALAAPTPACPCLHPADSCLSCPFTHPSTPPWQPRRAGDPTDAVLAALVAGERAFGADVNSKGFKVLRGVGVIQVRQAEGRAWGVGRAAAWAGLCAPACPFLLDLSSPALTTGRRHRLSQHRRHPVSGHGGGVQRGGAVEGGRHSRPWGRAARGRDCCPCRPSRPAPPTPLCLPARPPARVQSVAFGMGGGLLQKVNRDTLSLATKLCHIVYEDGTGMPMRRCVCVCVCVTYSVSVCVWLDGAVRGGGHEGACLPSFLCPHPPTLPTTHPPTFPHRQPSTP